MGSDAKIHHDQNGTVLTVESGGTLDVKSGGAITVESGGSLTVSGVTVDQHTLAVNGLTASGSDLNETGGLPTAQSTVVVAAASGTHQDITITLLDADGDALAAVRRIEVYVCDDAAGATPSSAAAAGNVTVQTGALLKAVTAKLQLEVLTDATGVAVIRFDNGGGGGAYTKHLAVILPSGAVVVSAAMNIPTA